MKTFRHSRAIASLFFFVAAPVHAATHHVILCGSGGEAPFISNFSEWGLRLRDALVSKLDTPTANVHVLLVPVEGKPLPDFAKEIALEPIRATLKQIEPSVNAVDDVALYMIGHGSYLARPAISQLPMVQMVVAATTVQPLA